MMPYAAGAPPCYAADAVTSVAFTFTPPYHCLRYADVAATAASYATYEVMLEIFAAYALIRRYYFAY